MQRLVCCAVVACLAALVQAQTTPAPKPPAELKQLDYFVGKWNCEGVNKLTNAKGASEGQCAWFKGGFVLECPTHTTAPSEREDVWIFGFSTADKAYTAYHYGSTGASPGVHKGQRSGTTWTFVREGTFEGKPTKFQVVVNEVSASRYTTQSRRSVEGGPWTVTQEGSCTKAK